MRAGAAFLSSACGSRTVRNPFSGDRRCSLSLSSRRLELRTPRRRGSKTRVLGMRANVDEKETANPDVEPAGGEEPAEMKSSSSPRYGLGAVYVAFLTFAFFLAPGSATEFGELGKVLSGNIDETNDLFYAINNLLLITGVNFAALLNAGAPRQTKLSTRLFSVAGTLLGFFGLGPYLVGRDYVPKISAEEVAQRGTLSQILESRWFPVLSLTYGLWVYAFAFGLFTPGTQQFHDVVFYASLVDLLRIVSSDRWAAVTCVDLTLLSILTWGPLTEDMCRRGWFTEEREIESILTALSFILVPALGPAIYLITRPRLPMHQAADK